MPILTYVRWHDVFFHTLPFVRTKGNTKNRRGETISGSATATALNRMPAALLKQSKDFRFFTLRRRGRPSSEIASAAGLAGACVFLRPFEPRSSPPLHRGGLLSHSDRRRRTADQKTKPIRVIPHFSLSKKKNEWNLYQQPPVCDANPRPTARWHDVFFHTLPFVQTKGLRFFTLRRCGRPSSEIASAAGWAGACGYCDSLESRSSPPPPCGGLQLALRSFRPPPSANSTPKTENAARGPSRRLLPETARRRDQLTTTVSKYSPNSRSARSSCSGVFSTTSFSL